MISHPAPSSPSPTSYNPSTNFQGYGNTINCQGTATPSNNALVDNARRYRAQGVSAWDGHVSGARRSAAKHETVKTCLATKGLKIERRVSK